MTKIEDRCVDCGLPCLGDSCPNRNVPVCYCDKCGEEIDGAIFFSDREGDLCEDCMKKLVKEHIDDVMYDLEDELLEYFGFVKER